MAISIIITPNNWQNCYNEMVFNISSTNANEPGFQFVIDVNINGQSNPVSRLILPKQPNTSDINVDIGEILRNYIGYNFESYNVSGLVHCENSKVDYWVEFGEIYNNGSGVPTIHPNLANFGYSDNNKHSSNAIFDFLNWSKTAYIDYDINDPILSGMTLNQNIFEEKLRYGEERFLTVYDWKISNGTGVFGNLNFQVLNANYDVLNQTNKGFTPIGSIVSINVGNSGNSIGIFKELYDYAFSNKNAKYIKIYGQSSLSNYLISPTDITNAAWGKDSGITLTHYSSGGFGNEPYDNYTNNSNISGLRIYQELTTSSRPYPNGTYSVYLRGSGTIRLGIYQSPSNPTTEFQLTSDWKLYQIERTGLIDDYMHTTIFFDSVSINCDICLSSFDNSPTTYFSKTFLIDNSCTKYESVRLHWLNNLGGFDAFTFMKVSRNRTDVERKQYKKFQPLDYAKTFRAKTNYYTKASDSITINSDYLTDAEYEGMKQLIESPIIMMEVDSSTYVPVNIVETNYEQKRYVNDRRMSNIELTIQYTFDNFRQSL